MICSTHRYPSSSIILQFTIQIEIKIEILFNNSSYCIIMSTRSYTTNHLILAAAAGIGIGLSAAHLATTYMKNQCIVKKLLGYTNNANVQGEQPTEAVPVSQVSRDLKSRLSQC